MDEQQVRIKHLTGLIEKHIPDSLAVIEFQALLATEYDRGKVEGAIEELIAIGTLTGRELKPDKFRQYVASRLTKLADLKSRGEVIMKSFDDYMEEQYRQDPTLCRDIEVLKTLEQARIEAYREGLREALKAIPHSTSCDLIELPKEGQECDCPAENYWRPIHDLYAEFKSKGEVNESMPMRRSY